MTRRKSTQRSIKRFLDGVPPAKFGLYVSAIFPFEIDKSGGARFTSRAAAMRTIAVGDSLDFVLDEDTPAAGIRGTAYHALGRYGCVSCSRIEDDLVRVTRLK